MAIFIHLECRGSLKKRISMKKCDQETRLNPYQYGFYLSALTDSSNKSYIVRFGLTFSKPIKEEQLSRIKQWMYGLPEIFAKLEIHGSESVPVLVRAEPRIDIIPEERCLSLAQSGAISLEDDRLYRIYAAESDKEIKSLYFLLHHILVDQTGVETIISNLSTFLQDSHCEQYPDILTDAKCYEEEQSIWLEKIQSFETVTLFDPNHHTQAHVLQCEKITLIEKLSSEIDRYSQSNYITPAIFFFGIMSFVMSALTRSNRILLGTVVNAAPEQERYLSCFANTSLFAMDFSEINNVDELWAQASEAMFNVLEQRKIPFWTLKKGFSEKRKEDLELPFFMSFAERHKNHCPLFKWYYLPDSHPKFPLNVTIVKGQKDYIIECNFDTHYYSGSYISQVMSMVSTTVNKLIDGRQDVGLHEVDFFTECPPSIAPPSFKSLINTFEDNAHHSGQPCYINDSGALSLHDVNRHASAIAAKLSKLGVTAGDRVMIEAVRDHRFLAALLALWKLGASFVPVEDDIPPERLRKIEAATHAKAFLVASITVSTSALQSDFDTFTQDDSWLNTTAVTSAQQEAYVVFTSGSTGEPKGVSVSHGNVAHYADAMVEKLYETLGDTHLSSLTFAVVSTLSSDLGYTSIFTSLSLGARLTILSKVMSLDAQAFSQALKNRQVDVLKIAPTHFASLATVAGQAALLPRKLLISGGEVLSRASHDHIKRHGIRVLNHYGPTETTVGVATWHDQISAADAASAPLGQPLGLNQILITDHRYRALPSGFEGEIVVYGPGVSQGYLSGKHTSFFNVSGAKAYATGDNGWLDAASCLHFRKRKDQQIKINGHRVEIAEIESAIAKYIPVADYHLHFLNGSFVLFTLEKYRHAWGETLAALQQELPGYMLPSATHYLPVMPMTTTGKIDRQTLMTLESPQKSLDSDLEKIHPLIIKAWEQHIGIPGSIHDSIYFQGANSIKAIQLLADISGALGLKVSLGQFLRNPRLSYFMDQKEMHHEVFGSSVALSAIDGMTSMQKSMWNINQLDPGDSTYNVPILIHLKKEFSIDALIAAIRKLVEHIDVLRTTFVSTGNDVTGIKNIDWMPKIEQVEFSENTQLISNLVSIPFTLATAPPFRIFFDKRTVLIVLHHIITDNVSNKLILNALDEALDGATEITKVRKTAFQPVFSPLETSAACQYWEDKLRRVEHIVSWPKTIIQSHPEDIHLQDEILPSTAAALSDTFRFEGISMQSGLLSIFGMALSLFFNRTEILVYIPVTLRKTEDCFRQIGCGISTLPVLIKTYKKTPVLEQILLTKNSILDDLDKQYIDFHDLVKSAGLINKNGSLKSNILFSYEEETEEQWSNFSKRETEFSPAKFDISIDILKKMDKSIAVTVSSKVIKEKTLQALLKSFSAFTSSFNLQRGYTLEDYALNTANKPLKGCLNSLPSGSIKSAIHDAFRAHQDKCAIYEGEREYSYKELFSAAGSIGEKLSNFASEAPVIVCLHRSFEAIAAMVAVVLSGRTLIPMDGTSPASRVDGVRSGLNDYILIDQAYLRETALLPESGAAFTFPVDNLNKSVPLYMIFTSGSTGVPKGVPIRDEQFYNYLSWARSEYKIDTHSIVPLFTSLSYDLTLTSLFLPLIAGASIDVIGGANGIETMSYLSGRNKFYQMIKMTPTHLSILNQLLDGKMLRAGCIVLGGEQLHYETLHKIDPSVPVYNEYGPAEATVGCCLKKTFSNEIARGPVSIGTPVPGCSIVISGLYGQSLPEGIAGNMVIRGTQVFDGYLNQTTPALSFDANTGQRKYETGDNAYCLDGELHYIGRHDRQIKLNGHRIELEEIEQVLLHIEGVISVQIEAYFSQDSQYLIAIIDIDNHKNSLEEVKKQLAIKLPHHMNPKLYFSPDEVAVGDSGKLDIEKMIRARKNVFTEMHQTRSSEVRNIWVSLLGKASFSDHANFFDAGGNSNLLLQLCRELSRAFKKEVRPIDLLSLTTIAQQEGFLTMKSGEAPLDSGVTSLSRRKTTPTDFLTRRNRG